jgi:AcrR family transcriptional regulator
MSDAGQAVQRHIRKQNRKPSRIPQERRKDLIEAAIRDIAAKGYDKVTVSSICEEAGFSRGLIGHYFASKDALLLEAVRSVAEQLGGAMREAVNTAGPDTTDKIHALIHASFTPPGYSQENIAVWASLAGTARWSPELAELYKEICRDYRAGVSRLFAKAAQVHKKDIDVAQLSLSFSQLVEGLWIGCNADPDVVSAQNAEECCHAFVRMALRAG